MSAVSPANGSAGRVGVLTFHSTTNYGATLQALGVVKALRALDLEPEIIDYRPRLATTYYRRELLGTDRLSHTLKYLRFHTFLRRHLPLSPARCRDAADILPRFGDRYPAIVCGSDQIWHVNRDFRPFDPSFFLDFADARKVRKVSYAPSFGTSFDISPFREAIRGHLSTFHALSVRDEDSQRLVRELGDREATRVLDPTLLVDFDAVPPKDDHAGGVDVFYGPHAIAAANQALSWSTQQGGQLVCLGYSGPRGSKVRIAIGPADWVGYLRHARMVFTTTFHGSVFAVKYGRPFIAITRPWNSAKILDFLDLAGLRHRAFDADQLPRSLPAALWDNTDVLSGQANLAPFIEHSRHFLRTSLLTA